MPTLGTSPAPTVLLRRTVRFAVNEPSDAPGARPDPIHNSYAGAPAIRGLGRHYELTVACRGDVDAHTGYFLNIKAIDTACRNRAIPIISEAVGRAHAGHAEPAQVLDRVVRALNEELRGAVHAVRWWLTPYYSIEMAPPAPGSDSSSSVLLRQTFDFAAAHRLYVPDLSDEENRRLFGKCTNERGHGHNYKVEPCVQVPLRGTDQAPAFTLHDLERLTDETIIERFDHKHLNEDTDEFGPGGLNPSVENIARVCYDLLAPVIARHSAGARLTSITVWETDKTACTYPG